MTAVEADMWRSTVPFSLLLLLAAGCASVERQREPVSKELHGIFAECAVKAQPASHTQVARCSHAPVRTVYQRLDYPYMDLVDLFLAQWTAIATKADEGQLRPEDAQLQLMEQLFRLTAEAQRRDGQFDKHWLLLAELRPSLVDRR
jgi:hypothetical protein